MVDYRKFLGTPDALIAPWLGGRTLDAADGRRLKLGALPARPGWYRFELRGRLATATGPAEPPDLSGLPRVRGFLWRDRLVTEGARAEPLHLLPEEEPPRLSPVSARRWPGGALLFEVVEFESEAEGAAREALATGAPLGAVKAVPAPLRAAWGYALGEQTARRLGVPVSAGELRRSVGRIAEGGLAAAEAVLKELVAEREQTERELRELRDRRAAAEHRAELEALREARLRARGGQPLEDRAWEALEKAGATFESSRHAGEGQAEVVFGFMGERFICLVDEQTLQVLDSGICLGHPPADKVLTLDSLPSVIKEALDTDALVILRAP